MALLVAVLGVVLQPLGIVVPNTGTITIVSVPSPKVFGEGRGVYKDSLLFTVTGANAAGYVAGTVATVGVASIPATAVKLKAEGIFVMRILDQATVAMIGNLAVIGQPPTPFNEPWQISDPNQTKLLGN